MHNFKKLTQWQRPQIIGLGASILILALAFLLFNLTSNESAKLWDIKWGYWWFLGLGIFTIGALALNAKHIFKSVRNSLPPLYTIIIAVLASFLLVGFINQNITRQHRVLSDENSWESMGLQMLYHQTGGVCNQGTWENGKLNCTDEVNNFKGKSLAFVYSVIFKFMPAHRDTALSTSLPLYWAALLLLFFAIYRFSLSSALALSAMIFLGTMPIMIFQAQSASTEVLYIFLLSTILLLYALFPPDKVTWKQLLLAIGILGFLSGTRQETVFCFIPFTLYYHDFLRKRAWHLPAFVTLLLVASWPAINTMAAYRGYDFQGGTHAAHSLANLWFNIKSNLSIMTNPGIDSQGLLKNPFYALYSYLLLGSVAWLIGRMIISRKYVWEGLLFALFHLQSLVILVNVSGTFEIDINQRYVLIALPSFAWIMALGLWDFLQTVPAAHSPLKRYASALTIILTLGLGLYFTVQHRADFQANILYRHNKLLTEEHFLNTELAKLPDSSLFLYSRPWQMLCSRFNSFNEQTLLSWSDQELAYWRQHTGDNIYLVRGQDGYGQVDRTSRVVGFKTTEPIQRILNEFNTTAILVNSQDFGYPLTVYHIGTRKGSSHYEQSLALYTPTPEIARAADLQVFISQSVSDTLEYIFTIDGQLNSQGALTPGKNSMTLNLELLAPGLHHLQAQVSTPEGPVHLEEYVFVQSPTVALLQNLNLAQQSQDWGAPQMGRSVENKTLTILNGKKLRFGIGTHANSSLIYHTNKQYSNLFAVIGLDDESACGDGAIWVVKGDGQEIYRSPRLTSQMADTIKLSIDHYSTLELLTLEAENNYCDHTNWGNAWLN